MCANDARRNALANVTGIIDLAACFPTRVFPANWRSCLFFDSDRMFTAQFAGTLRLLLDLEGSLCACMINFDQAENCTDDNVASSCLFIDQATTDGTFHLWGTSSMEGWMYVFDRFGCTSDVGEWYIYSEKASEMAVIAFRGNVPSSKFEPVIRQLEALPIHLAIEKPLSFVFSPENLLPVWRIELIKEYA